MDFVWLGSSHIFLCMVSDVDFPTCIYSSVLVFYLLFLLEGGGGCFCLFSVYPKLPFCKLSFGLHVS